MNSKLTYERLVRESESEICEMAIIECRECTRIDLLTKRGSRTTGQYWPGARSYHEKLQANIEAFCEKSGRDSP